MFVPSAHELSCNKANSLMLLALLRTRWEQGTCVKNEGSIGTFNPGHWLHFQVEKFMQQGLAGVQASAADHVARKDVALPSRIGIRRAPQCPGARSKCPAMGCPQAAQRLPSRFHRPNSYQSRSINSTRQFGQKVLPPLRSCTLPV